MKSKKNQNKLVTVSAFGNWRSGERTWSRAAISAKNFAATSYFGVSVDPADLPLASEVIAQYNETHKVRAVSLAKTLAWDINRLGVLPYPFGQQMISSQAVASAFGHDIAECLREFGKLGILYSDSSTDFSERLVQNSIILEPDLMLTTRNIAMPVSDFLLWTKGTNEIRGSVIAEWSGIPVGKQGWVYKELLELFRNYLEDEHRAAKKYSQPIYLSTSGVQINCERTSVFNF